MKREEKESGIETDLTEVEMALEELIEKEDAAETERRVVENQRKIKDSQDRENAESTVQYSTVLGRVVQSPIKLTQG